MPGLTIQPERVPFESKTERIHQSILPNVENAKAVEELRKSLQLPMRFLVVDAPSWGKFQTPPSPGEVAFRLFKAAAGYQNRQQQNRKIRLPLVQSGTARRH